MESTGWRTVTMRLKFVPTPMVYKRYMMKMAFEDPNPYPLQYDIDILQVR